MAKTTEQILQFLTRANAMEVSISHNGTFFAVKATEIDNPQRTIVGIGESLQAASQDCWDALRVAEEIDRRIKACLCCRSFDGKFTCNKAIEPQPGADATNSSHWCSICTDCQKAEMDGYARSESAEAARIERDYR